MKCPGGLLNAAPLPISLPKFQETSLFVYRLKPPRPRRYLFKVYASSENSFAKTATSQNADASSHPQQGNELLNFEVRSAHIPAGIFSASKLNFNDQAFLLLAFIVCTTSVAFTSFVVVAVPTLFAIQRTAISLAKLADTARQELPSTMAAIRLSGMEISDLTLELSDLSQEIADGVNKSAQAVQAAEAGVRQLSSHAHQQTMAMVQERASLPIISLQPVVAGAAQKTSSAVGRAAKTFLNIISRGEYKSMGEGGDYRDRIES